MTRHILTAITLFFGLTLSVAAAEKKLPNGRGNPPNLVERMMKMNPAQRERALQNLPPARRDNIERRLNEIRKLPTAQQNRIRTRQEMLNSLPPLQQNQVRRSVRQFVDMPEERRGVMNQELNRMAPMSDEERQVYMGTEEFRNKFSAREQQMLFHLAEITPRPE